MGSFGARPQLNGTKEAASERPAPHLRVHVVNVYVTDQDRSLQFYVDQLGFNLAFDARMQTGDRWVSVSPPDGTAMLSLVAPRIGSKEYALIGRDTGVVLVTDNVIAKYTEWRKRGVRFQYAPRLRRVRYDQIPEQDTCGKDADWGAVFTHFLDPDGNSCALVGLDAVTRQVEAQRRAQAEKLEAERRTAQELEIAKQVQARLFPQVLPPVGSLEYAGVCIQARKVGGDYYDFIELAPGRVGIVLADISGKGIAAALLMATLQANLRAQCAMAQEPKEMLRLVNRTFHENSTDSSYATLFFADYQTGTRKLRYANCGHLPALLLRADGGLEKLESTGTVVGLFSHIECATGECTVGDGDTLAIYSDGITEACSRSGEEFGEERLIEALRRHQSLPVHQLISAVIDEVHRFSTGEQQDDITLTVAKGR